jgi:uncharacterized glyoxalase superfamily protein PhnB
MNKLSPIIFVDAIEPCLPFWTDRLGFEVTVTVPHGDELGFAILQKGGVELMYQTHASLEGDLPALSRDARGNTTTLFIEVDDVDDVERALAGVEVLVPRRQTFYGMDEIFVRAPCGTVLGFAAPVAKESAAG